MKLEHPHGPPGEPGGPNRLPREWTVGGIAMFWVPLAATWLMMSLEGPFLTAVIARLERPEHNLAAFGVAFSLALIVEAPIIMIMSASTALVKDGRAYFMLRRFTNALNVAITLLMFVLLAGPVFSFVSRTLIGLPEDVADLTRAAAALMLPWPAAIGYRRFYQGIMIRYDMTRRVAYGTAIRLVTMTAATLVLTFCFHLPGACVGGAALSAGVVLEAAASRWMAHPAVRHLVAGRVADIPGRSRMTYRSIASFYFPLALTSVLALAVNPLVTFFVGHGRMALESLAVLPVINSLAFLFKCFGISFQEVGVAVLADDRRGIQALGRFGWILGACTTGALSVIALTPLSALWFERVSGLSPGLTAYAVVPLRLLCLMPGLEVLLSFQRSLLVHARRTRPITLATALEVGAIVAVLQASMRGLDWPGAIAAALAFFTGRVAANAYLLSHTRRAL